MSLIDAMKKGEPKGSEIRVAEVVDNQDPLQMRRLKIRTSLHSKYPDDHLPWALCGVFQSQGGTSGAGSFAIPLVGSSVLVQFQAGDPDQPIYVGTLADSSNVPALFKTNYPHRVGVLFDGGSYVYVDCQENEVKLSHQGTTVVIDSAGKVTVNVASDVDLTVNGNVTASVTGDVNLTVGGSVNSVATTWNHQGDFSLTGNFTLLGNSTQTGAASLAGNLTVVGTAAFSGGTMTHNGVNMGGGHKHNVNPGAGVLSTNLTSIPTS